MRAASMTRRAFASRDVTVQSWYVACRSSTLRRGRIVAFDVQGHKLVAYRDSLGRARVLEARCAHQGASLRHGSVEGDGVACAMHHWRYGSDGACVAAPGFDEAPKRRVRACATEERYGFVWCFVGAEPTFDIPGPFYDGAGFLWRLRPFDSKAHVHLLTGNPLDETHFGPLHQAEFAEPGVLRVEGKHRVALDAHVRVRGGPAARVPGVRGRVVDVTFSTTGPNLCLVEVRHPFAFTVLFAGRPTLEGGTRIQPMFFLPPGRAFDLPRALWLTWALTKDDEAILSDMDFVPAFTERDRGMRAFHDLVNEMPTWA